MSTRSKFTIITILVESFGLITYRITNTKTHTFNKKKKKIKKMIRTTNETLL